MVHVGNNHKDCQLNTTIDVGPENCKKEKRKNKRTRKGGKEKINERLITQSSLPHGIIETEQDGVDELHKMSTTRRQHSLGGDGKEANWAKMVLLAVSARRADTALIRYRLRTESVSKTFGSWCAVCELRPGRQTPAPFGPILLVLVFTPLFTLFPGSRCLDLPVRETQVT